MSSTSTDESVIWHDLECGRYSADLPVWRELAERAGGPLLDVGAGAGRVALDLARRGHDVTALDRDPRFLDALTSRAAAEQLEISTHLADAGSFRLDRRFALVLAPMQLIQLLDPPARAGSLDAIAACLLPGGLAAFAITVPLQRWTATRDASPPLPDVRELHGWIYSSLPVALEEAAGTLVVRRIRQTVSPDGALSESEDVVRLAALDPDTLEQEAERASLTPVERREIAATDDHVGSIVVILEKPR